MKTKTKEKKEHNEFGDIDYTVCQVCDEPDPTGYGLCDQCCEDMGARMLQRLGPDFFKM